MSSFRDTVAQAIREQTDLLGPKTVHAIADAAIAVMCAKIRRRADCHPNDLMVASVLNLLAEELEREGKP